MADLDFYNWNQQNYPGQQNNFYIHLYMNYNGSAFVGSNQPGNWLTMINANVTFDTVVDHTMAPANPSPITWVRKNVDNNAGAGLTLNDYNNYYLYDINGNLLQFNVITNQIAAGTYFIRFSLVADVMVSYDTLTSTPTYAKQTQVFFTRLDIMPSFGFGSVAGWSDYQGGTENLYAGAVHEKLVSTIYQNVPGTVTNIRATLKIDDNHFHLMNPQAVAYQLTGWYDLHWIVDIDKGTPANHYQCEVTYSYTLNGNTEVTETTPMYFNLTVQWTPILKFPDSLDHSKPLVKVYQGAPEANFTVPIKNDGNVKMMNVTVRLDLNNAAYFKDGQYYYDEYYGGQIRYKDITFNLGDINTGESKNAVFSDVILKAMLPPGQYVIPVSYIGSYLDTGVIGSSDMRMAGYWDDGAMGFPYLYDYENIHWASDYPETYSVNPMYPYIFVEVADNAHGVDVTGMINGLYYPNSKNNYMRLDVYDYENYFFSNVVYTIHTDGGSPIKRQGVPDTDPSTALMPITRSSLGPGQPYDYLYFYADMRQIAPTGTNFIQVDVAAIDPHGMLVKFSFDAAITVGANSPQFEMLKYTTEMSNNQTARVTCYFENVGWGSATNMSLFFRPSSASMIMVDAPIFFGKIVPGQLFNYSFTVKPSNDQQAISGNWQGYVYSEYTNDGGQIVKMFTGTSNYVNFIVQPKLPSIQVTNVLAPAATGGAKMTVKITVANLGGSTAYGTKIIWSDTQSMFGVETGESSFTCGDLAPGATYTATFTVRASKALLPSTAYAAYVYVSYTRVDGFGMTYAEGGSRSFTFHTPMEVVPSKQLVEHQNSGYTFDIGYMMLGLFIMIGVIAAVVVYRRPAPAPRMYEPAVAEPVRQTPPGPQK